jgi:hypothetical protein
MTHKALALGTALGFLLAAASSCGPTVVQTRCQASNCDGCCDEFGECRGGTELEACGELGATCSVCSAGQTCSDGTCRGGSTLEADAGVDAGTIDSGVPCGPSTCANGCCQNGEGTPGTGDAACGTGGGACTSCMGNQICSAGACTDACQGCRDATGACVSGDQLDACGSGGLVCSACFAGQICENGQCKDTTCSASNCNGCCAGDTCIEQVTDAQCGAGGTACETCQNNATCQMGQCTGGDLPDSGFPTGNCGPQSCSGCCADLFGVPECFEAHETDEFACGLGGVQCQVCFFGFGVCNAGTCTF